MNLKTYDFTKYDRVFVADGNGGFSTVDKDKLSASRNEVLVVGNDCKSHIEWAFDGTTYSEFYVKNDYGNIVKIEPDYDIVISCCVRNPKSGTAKFFCVDYVDGFLQSTCELSGIIDENGVLVSHKVIVTPGRYRREEGLRCGGAFLVKEMDIFSDEAHASWYSEPKIDGIKETARADLVRIPDSVINCLTTRFINLKAFADSNNIKLIVDEYSGDIRAVKVPEGYKVESDEGDYCDMIPWELMPVIGKCNFTMNEDSEYQPTLIKIVKEADNG